jgi:trigger factor
VEFNDLLVMDVNGVMEGETVIEQKGAQYQVTEGHTFPMTGFPEQLTGMKINDEKEFELEYPGDTAEEDLAGKKVTFKVKAIDIKQEILPEANDEFAKTVGAEFESLDALREQARTDMTTRAEDQARINFEEELVHAVADISVVEYPPVFVESEINRILNRQLQGSNISLEDYLERVNKTEEELREEVRPSAEHSVVHSLVLSKLAEAEEMKVTDEEVDGEIERMTENSTEKKEELKKFLNDPQIRESITQNLIHRKTIEKLAEYSAVTEKPKKTRARKKKKEEGK